MGNGYPVAAVVTRRELAERFSYAGRTFSTFGGNPVAASAALAVLDVLVGAEGGVVGAEELLERAWDANADPFTNAVRITVSALRKRLGEPWIIATVAGVGYRMDVRPETRHDGPVGDEGDRGDGGDEGGERG